MQGKDLWKELATIIKLNSEECPFSKKMEEEELWNYVKECIEN